MSAAIVELPATAVKPQDDSIRAEGDHSRQLYPRDAHQARQQPVTRPGRVCGCLVGEEACQRNRESLVS